MNEILFKVDLPVRVSDISYGGHVGNDRFLSLAQESRVLWLRSIGLEENCLILMDAHISFLKEVFLGDTLTFELEIQEMSKCGMTLYYRVTKKESGELASEITTKIAFFDYEKKKITKAPEAITQLTGEAPLNE